MLKEQYSWVILSLLKIDSMRRWARQKYEPEFPHTHDNTCCSVCVSSEHKTYLSCLAERIWIFPLFSTHKNTAHRTVDGQHHFLKKHKNPVCTVGVGLKTLESAQQQVRIHFEQPVCEQEHRCIKGEKSGHGTTISAPEYKT